MFLVFIGFLIQDLIDMRDSILGASSSFLEVVEMVCTGLTIFLWMAQALHVAELAKFYACCLFLFAIYSNIICNFDTCSNRCLRFCSYY